MTMNRDAETIARFDAACKALFEIRMSGKNPTFPFCMCAPLEWIDPKKIELLGGGIFHKSCFVCDRQLGVHPAVVKQNTALEMEYICTYCFVWLYNGFDADTKMLIDNIFQGGIMPWKEIGGIAYFEKLIKEHEG